MRPALRSVAIQAAGSAASFASALLVASLLGLAAQGSFGLLRTWSDAAVTLAVLGLPQALLHLQYRERVPIAALRAWVGRYLRRLFVFAALAIVLVAVAWTRLAQPGWPARWPVLVVAAAVPFGAAHLLGRALLLREVGPVAYAAVTAAPALLLLAGVLPVGLAGAADALAAPLLLSALLSALLTGALVRRAAAAAAPGAVAAVPRRTLWSVGLETGGQSVLTAFAPPLLLSTAGWLGGPLAEIGIVSLGLHVYQLFGVAAAYVAPMAYDRAARADRTIGTRELLARLRSLLDRRTAFALAGAAVLALVVLPLLWPAGVASAVLLVAMSAAGVLSMAVRLLVTLLLARGAFRPLTWHALGRVLLGCGLTAVLMQRWSAPVAVPLALLIAEALLLAWALALMRLTHAGPAAR